jgi:hypothetical protein
MKNRASSQLTKGSIDAGEACSIREHKAKDEKT